MGKQLTLQGTLAAASPKAKMRRSKPKPVPKRAFQLSLKSQETDAISLASPSPTRSRRCRSPTACAEDAQSHSLSPTIFEDTANQSTIPGTLAYMQEIANMNVAQPMQNRALVEDPKEKTKLEEVDFEESLVREMKLSDEKAGSSPSPLEEQFRDAMDEGNFDIRGKIGQRFQKEHKKGSDAHTAYARCKTFEEKKQFRLTWLERKYNEVRQGRRHSESWREVDIQKGEYMPLAKLIESEGFLYDPEGAKEAGYSHARRCAQLGGAWVVKNDFSGRLEYLKMKKEFKHIMSKCWELYEENTASADNSESRSCASKATTSMAVTTTQKQKVGDKPETPGKTAKRAKTKMETALIEARKVRALYLSTTASVSTLDRQISEGSPAWSWANNPENLGKLRGMIQQMESSMEVFDKSFLVAEGDIKKQYDEAQLQVHLEGFCRHETQLRAIDTLKRKIIAMQAAFQKD